MIAVDTSSLVAYFEGEKGHDIVFLDSALEMKQVVLPPVVLTEILSDPKLDSQVATLLKQLPLLEISENFWEKAALTRSKVLRQGFKARVADALIAQSCLDHYVPLLTRDRDFKHFSKWCGLQLVS